MDHHPLISTFYSSAYTVMRYLYVLDDFVTHNNTTALTPPSPVTYGMVVLHHRKQTSIQELQIENPMKDNDPVTQVIYILFDLFQVMVLLFQSLIFIL